MSASKKAPDPNRAVFPPLGTTLARGFGALAVSPILLFTTLLLVPAVWLVLAAVGSRVFPSQMGTVLALPPIGTIGDLSLADSMFGLAGRTAFVFVIAETVIRGLIIAILAGLLDEAMDHRSVSMAGVIRGLKGATTVVAFCFVNLGLVVVGFTVISAVLGQAGRLAPQIILVGGLFFLAFTPAVAVRIAVPIREAIARSWRAARLPVWPRHLLMAVVYYFVASVVFGTLGLFALGAARGLTATPGLRLWSYAMAVNLVHVGFLGGFIYRWKCIEVYIPPQTARKRPAGASVARGRRLR